MSAGTAAPAHRVEPVRVTGRRRGVPVVLGFRASCSCGDHSGPGLLSTAGMVSGWEAAHREQEGDL